MRSTITLEDDVVTKIKSEMAKGDGKTFKEAVNGLIRRGYYVNEDVVDDRRPFKLAGRTLTPIRHFNFDKISLLLEQVEGSDFK